MGTTDLYDVIPLLGLRCNLIMQRIYRRNQPLLHIDRRREYMAEPPRF